MQRWRKATSGPHLASSAARTADRGDVRLTRGYTRETSNEWMDDPNGRPTEGDTNSSLPGLGERS